MAFTSSTNLEGKSNAGWTREEKLVEKVRTGQRSGIVFSGSEITDLLAILLAVDDYTKGSAVAMDAIKTNYLAHKGDKK